MLKNKVILFIFFVIVFFAWIFLVLIWLNFFKNTLGQKHFHHRSYPSLLKVNAYSLSCEKNKIRQTIIFDLKSFSMDSFLNYLEFIEYPFYNLELNVKPKTIGVDIEYHASVATTWYNMCIENSQLSL